MRIKKGEGDISGTLKFTEKQLEQLKKYGLFGIPKQDKKGHDRFFNTRVQPLQMDLITGIREKVPGWYRSNAELYRAIVAAGTFTILNMIDQDERIDELNSILSDMNTIAQVKRLRDLREEIVLTKKEYMDGKVPAEGQDKVIMLLDRIEKKYRDVLKEQEE